MATVQRTCKMVIPFQFTTDRQSDDQKEGIVCETKVEQKRQTTLSNTSFTSGVTGIDLKISLVFNEVKPAVFKGLVDFSKGIQLTIFKHLDLSDLARCVLVSKKLSCLVSDPAVYKEKVRVLEPGTYAQFSDSFNLGVRIDWRGILKSMRLAQECRTLSARIARLTHEAERAQIPIRARIKTNQKAAALVLGLGFVGVGLGAGLSGM